MTDNLQERLAAARAKALSYTTPQRKDNANTTTGSTTQRKDNANTTTQSTPQRKDSTDTTTGSTTQRTDSTDKVSRSRRRWTDEDYRSRGLKTPAERAADGRQRVTLAVAPATLATLRKTAADMGVTLGEALDTLLGA